jgi:predicted RNase H-like HicB family nuclease
MEKIIVRIEKSKNHYGAYAENVEGLYAAGNTPAEVKNDFMETIRLFKEYNSEENIPEILKGDYEIEYLMDIPTLLKTYSGIFTKSALERLTGINRVQFSHYVSGFRKPRKDKKQKIEKALYSLADDLKQVHIV